MALAGHERSRGDDAGVAGLASGLGGPAAAGQVQDVHAEAVARLRQVGWEAVPAPPREAPGDAAHIAAAASAAAALIPCRFFPKIRNSGIKSPDSEEQS